MNSIVKAALVLFGVIAVLTLGLSFSGMMTSSPMVAGLLFIAVAILANAGCLFWGLSGTAAESGYGKQVLNSIIFGLVAGVLIFAFSFINLTVLQPDLMEEVKQASIEMLEGMEMPDQVREKQIEATEARTPMGEAIGGLVGTVVTSLVLGLIIAIFKRKK